MEKKEPFIAKKIQEKNILNLKAEWLILEIT